MYPTTVDASRPQSPGTTAATTASRPTASDVAELLRTADSDERCTEAAVTFARACADFPEGTLRELLSGLPAEAPLPLLCQKLADALASEKVTSATVWNDLLNVIRSDKRLADAQLALHQHCAQCLAELKVTDATVWSQVAALPTNSPDALVQAGAQIAASMVRAGVEAPVLWDTLITAMAHVSAASPVGHAQVAQGLAHAGVGCAAAWTALWRHCAGAPGRNAVVAAAMTMLLDERELSSFAVHVGVESLLNTMRDARITDRSAWLRALGAAARQGNLMQAMAACVNERDSSIRLALLSEISKAAADGSFALKPLFVQYAQRLGDWSGQDTACAALVDGLTDQLVAQCGPQGRSEMLALAQQCAPRATGAPPIGRRIVDQLLASGPTWSATDLTKPFRLLLDLRSPLTHWQSLMRLVVGDERAVLRSLLKDMGGELSAEHWTLIATLAAQLDGASATQLYLDCVQAKVWIGGGGVSILEKLGEAAFEQAQSEGPEALLRLAEGMVAQYGKTLPELTRRAVTAAVTAARQSGDLRKSSVLSRVVDVLVQCNERTPEVWAMLPTLVVDQGYAECLAQYEKVMKVFTLDMKRHPDCQRLLTGLANQLVERAKGESFGSLVGLAERMRLIDGARAVSFLTLALQRAEGQRPEDLVKVAQLLAGMADNPPSTLWRQLWIAALSQDPKSRREFHAAFASVRMSHQAAAAAFAMIVDVAKDYGHDTLIEVVVRLHERSQVALVATALPLVIEALESRAGPQLILFAGMFITKPVDSPDDAVRLASLLTRAARGCDAAQLQQLFDMAAMLTALGEQQQGELWAAIWHETLQLDVKSLHVLYDSVKDRLQSVVVWTKLVEAASALGLDALNNLWPVLAVPLRKEEAFCGPGQDILVNRLVQVAFEEQLVVHKACRELGPWHLCNIILNTRLEKIAHYSRPHRSMVKNAIVDGTLKLDDIEEIRNHRDLVRKAVPGIGWEVVFNPGMEAPTTRLYAGFPQLHQAATGCVKALQGMAPGLAQWGQNLQKAKVDAKDPLREELTKLNVLMKDLITQVSPKSARSFLSKVVVELWGPDGPGIPIGEQLMSHLIQVRKGEAKVHSSIDELIPKLLNQLNVVLTLEDKLVQAAGEFESPYAAVGSTERKPTLKDASATFQVAWNSLATLVADKDFVEHHAMGSDYIVSLINPNDVSNLILGHKVSCCGSPQGLHPELMMERLAGGWVVWSIAKTAGDTAAVAWATLNEQQDLVIDFVDERVNFRKPPLGNDLVEALFAFGPKVAAAIGAKKVWGAPPLYGRLEGFSAFKRPRQMQTFQIGVPPFMGKAPYTDSLDKGVASYFIIERQ